MGRFHGLEFAGGSPTVKAAVGLLPVEAGQTVLAERLPEQGGTFVSQAFPLGEAARGGRGDGLATERRGIGGAAFEPGQFGGGQGVFVGEVGRATVGPDSELVEHCIELGAVFRASFAAQASEDQEAREDVLRPGCRAS